MGGVAKTQVVKFIRKGDKGDTGAKGDDGCNYMLVVSPTIISQMISPETGKSVSAQSVTITAQYLVNGVALTKLNTSNSVSVSLGGINSDIYVVNTTINDSYVEITIALLSGALPLTNRITISVTPISYSGLPTLSADVTVAYPHNGEKGNTGNGIASVTEYYLASTSSSGVTTSTSGWTTAIQTITATKRYLWNYEVIAYDDGTTKTTTPVIIGVYGDTGAKGEQGAVLRGPQAWSDCTAGYAFQAGGEGEQWKDVVLYNGNYYSCVKSHTKTNSIYPGSITATNNGYWQLGDTIELVATKILLATYALVENLGVTAIDMKDCAGNVLFQAKDGNVTCKTGTFENVAVSGNLTVSLLKYKANEIYSGSLNCSFIYGGGSYTMPLGIIVISQIVFHRQLIYKQNL